MRILLLAGINQLPKSSKSGCPATVNTQLVIKYIFEQPGSRKDISWYYYLWYWCYQWCVDHINILFIYIYTHNSYIIRITCYDSLWCEWLHLKRWNTQKNCGLPEWPGIWFNIIMHQKLVARWGFHSTVKQHIFLFSINSKKNENYQYRLYQYKMFKITRGK